MPPILGIDPGTACGWCVRHDERRIDSGVWDLSPKRHEGAGMRGVRFRRLLQEILDSARPAIVAYEEVQRHLGTDAAHVYGGLVLLLQEECEHRAIPYTGIPVATVKKAATGKGNAPKSAMIDAAARRWPNLPLFDDNEADARWIAEVAASLVPKPHPERKAP